jgi:hypothetical protein
MGVKGYRFAATLCVTATLLFVNLILLQPAIR